MSAPHTPPASFSIGSAFAARLAKVPSIPCPDSSCASDKSIASSSCGARAFARSASDAGCTEPEQVSDCEVDALGGYGLLRLPNTKKDNGDLTQAHQRGV
jgi:hypothetical protein